MRSYLEMTEESEICALLERYSGSAKDRQVFELTCTVAFLINGLLGVSFEDLTKDFELTSFSSSGRRWRSDIQNGVFTLDGVMEDDPTTNYVGWNKMYKLLMNNYGKNASLSEAIEQYLIEHCEIPQEQIDEVKRIMLVGG